MSDDASDVTKALAAFGAPAIRYHSFGHAPVRPSSVVLPRRIGPPVAAGPVQRAEPAAAPGPVLRTALPALPRPPAAPAAPIEPLAGAPSRLRSLVLPPLLQPSAMHPPATPTAAPPVGADHPVVAMAVAPHAPQPAPLWARPRAASPSQTGAVPEGNVGLRSLPEIFEFLAADT